MPSPPRRWPRRRVWLWAAVGVWCVLTWWLAVLPREEVRAWEIALVYNDYFREVVPREWLVWRPPGFSLMGHVTFYVPFGVAAWWAGQAWGRKAMGGVLVAACVWAAGAEASQFLVDDRTPRLLDLSASWGGIALGLGFCYGVAWLTRVGRRLVGKRPRAST